MSEPSAATTVTYSSSRMNSSGMPGAATSSRLSCAKVASTGVTVRQATANHSHPRSARR